MELLESLPLGPRRRRSPVFVTLAAMAALACGCRAGARLGSGDGLVAGVTDDNVRLPEYLDYVASYPHADVPKLDLSDRQIVTFVGADDRPLWDVAIRVPAGSGFDARTNAEGNVLLPRAELGLAGGRSLEVVVDDVLLTVVDPGSTVAKVDTSARDVRAGVPLDVALVVDTTSTMGDEIDLLRRSLVSVVRRIGDHPLDPAVRIGGVAYRDVGEAYVTREFPFTSDLREVQRTLDLTTAAGGGDHPEAVQEALDVAVNRLDWRGAGAIRLLFLIGDAPPHFERGTPYTQTLRDAIRQGITIVPIACSGMDDRGEFVWRQLAALTLGEFLFVSQGGTSDTHTGPYVENDLDALMLRVVGKHLDALLRHPAFDIGTWPHAPYASPWMPHAPAGRIEPRRAAPDRIGLGRSPWDFEVPGWPRR